MHLATISALLATLMAAPQTQPADDVPAILRDRVDNGLATGMSVALIHGDGMTFYHHGVRAVDDPTPVDAQTFYEIGSITKVFTALALAEMAARDAVALDDPLARYWPTGSAPPQHQNQGITLRQLAQHTSGLPRMPGNFAPQDPHNPYADYPADRLFAFLGGYPLSRTPGSQYAYSNLGCGLLGELLARNANTSYCTLIERRICRPLGLHDTTCSPDRDQVARLAKGHHGPRLTPSWDFQALAGCGALRSTAADMARFVQAQLDPDQTPLAEAIRLTLDRGQEAPAGADMTVTLGWHLSTRGERALYWHNGGTGGYRSFVGFDRARRFGVVVLSNGCYSADDVGWHLLDETRPLREVRQATKVDLRDLRACIGRYALSPVTVFEVTLENGTLFIQAPGQAPLPIWPASPDRFFYRDVDAEITFKRGDSGAVDKLVLHQGGIEQTAKRVTE